MKSQMNWQESSKAQQSEQSLFVSSHRNVSQNDRGLGVKLNDIWQRAIAHLELSSEPHVWRTQDALGRIVWSGYAPDMKQSIQQVSASEMRIWLEEQQA